MLAGLVLGLVALLAGNDPRVVGAWGLRGDAVLTFRADGTGELEGEPFRWSTEGAVLTVVPENGETEKMGYSVKDGTLGVAMDGVPLSFQRIGNTSSGTAAAVRVTVSTHPEGDAAAPAVPATAPPALDGVSRILASTPWCTSASRLHFFADGTYSRNARGASPAGAETRARWKMKDGRLHMSETADGELRPVLLSVTRGTDGAPAVHVDGNEFSPCP